MLLHFQPCLFYRGNTSTKLHTHKHTHTQLHIWFTKAWFCTIEVTVAILLTKNVHSMSIEAKMLRICNKTQFSFLWMPMWMAFQVCFAPMRRYISNVHILNVSRTRATDISNIKNESEKTNFWSIKRIDSLWSESLLSVLSRCSSGCNSSPLPRNKFT